LDTEALEREFRSVDYFATRFWNDRTRQLAALRRAAGEHLFAFVKAKNRQREFANWNLRLDNLEAQARGALRDYERGVLGFADGNAEKPGHVEDIQTFKNKFSQFAQKPLDVVEAPLSDREPRSQRRDVAADALARAMARRDVEAVLQGARDYIEYVINETGHTQSQKDYLRSNYLSLPPMRPGDCLRATRRSVGNLIKEMERRGLSHFFFADLSNIDSAPGVAEGWLR